MTPTPANNFSFPDSAQQRVIDLYLAMGEADRKQGAVARIERATGYPSSGIAAVIQRFEYIAYGRSDALGEGDAA